MIKKRRILKRLRELPPPTVILAEDETDLLLFPLLRSGWAKRGNPAPVQLSGFNEKRVIFGVINITTGHRIFSASRRQRGDDFCSFLEEIRSHYRGWNIALLLDGDPCHISGETQNLAPDLDIELLWLPKRSPHLNPMDHLWWHAKEKRSANWQYDSIDSQVADFVTLLENMSRREALTKAGLMSSDFWLNWKR